MLWITDWQEKLSSLLEDFGEKHNWLWQAGVNGRSGGYVVLYQGGIKPSGYKSYCTHCGQKNYQAVPEGQKGIVALAGIVVRNGILLVEFADLKIEEGMSTYDAILTAGRTRMTPVLLTAAATTLGLIPLAVGLNIDFATLFTTFNPHIFFGGDSVAFWGPLSWTMIFGLIFATFLTLILVPVMYILVDKLKVRLKTARSN
jgi:hypothetical protein